MSFKSTIHSAALKVAASTDPDQIASDLTKPRLTFVETKQLIQIKANIAEAIKKLDVIASFLKKTSGLATPFKNRLDGFDLGDAFHNLKHLQNDLKQHIALLEKELRT